MENLEELAENLANLTVLQCYQLAKIMKEVHGIVPNTKVMGINVSPIPMPAKVVEKTSFDVMLKSYGSKKLEVVKALKLMTGISLIESRDLVNAVPCKIRENISKEESNSLLVALEEVGAEVEIV